jgi:acyl-CoA thioesterase
MSDVDTALELHPEGEVWNATIPAGWGQGRTTFGGLVAAYLARAAEAACERPIRTIDVVFLEPVAAGDAQLRLDSIRVGKHLSHVEVSLHANGKKAAAARLVHSEATTGPLDTRPQTPTPERDFDAAPEAPYMPELMPEFLQNMQMRFGEGDPPMSGSARAVTGGFVRNLGPATGVAALLTHADAWPPPQLALIDRPAFASSVRWHVAFHADVSNADGQQWSWIRSEAVWRSGPLSTVTGTLVRDGVPVAYAEQTIVMYA